MGLSDLLAVARGEKPADLLLRNARIVNVFSGEIEPNDIAIFEGKIAGVGRGYSAKETLDLKNAFVAPGLIDAHVHIESSLCIPANFAAAVVPRGVTTVVADPHEIANVAGVAGIQFMVDASKNLPLRVIIMAPSCVPATSMATSGANLSADDLAPLLRDGSVHGLAEVMNFPGVIFGDKNVTAKISAFEKTAIDGHCPGVREMQLNAYVAAGVGSDHECVSVEEAREKLSRGLYLLIREATNAHNLHALLPLITPQNSRRICFCTDDRQPHDLLTQGSVDHMLREAIDFGVDPNDAFRCCTLNSAEWFGLSDRGAISPGRVADVIVFDNLDSPHAKIVIAGGKIVAEKGSLLPGVIAKQSECPKSLTQTVNVKWSDVHFKIKASSDRIRVIGSLADQLITTEQIIPAKIESGHAVSDTARDVLKMAVIERHGGTGKIGLGFIHGFGLKKGAIAGTVAHDHHNLVVIGCDDESMLAAATAVQSMNGGLAFSIGQQCVAALSLPIAGLMTDADIDSVRADYQNLLLAVRSHGASLHDPFMAMSFMALEVIPKLKLTDQGLVDVEKFQIVDLFV